MNIEEIIPILIAGLEKKYRDAKIKTNLISLLWCIALIGGIAWILGFVFHETLAQNLSLMEYLSEHKRLSILFPLPFFIGGLFIVHLCRKSSIESQELGFSRNKELLMEPKSHHDYYRRGQFLLENKYYELAHDDLSKAIDELYRESEELSEKLSRFLEEYMKLPGNVEGFPRPVPYFQNHHLGTFLQYYWTRKTNLERLERFG